MSSDRDAAIARQELRRSNAAVPIPAAKHKRRRTRVRQELREERRELPSGDIADR